MSLEVHETLFNASDVMGKNIFRLFPDIFECQCVDQQTKSILETSLGTYISS